MSIRSHVFKTKNGYCLVMEQGLKLFMFYCRTYYEAQRAEREILLGGTLDV